ncbi:hypothetical protein ONZ45_g4915 [Pleurotus djamor]|nr:hypothetical protein ONZ45_g4915 [Pleurotus djamor]
MTVATLEAPSLPKPLQIPLSKDDLDKINAYLKDLTPEDILKWAIDYIPDLYQTTAFGLTGLVAIDMLSKITTSPPPLIFIDTLYHFPETYELVEEVKKRYSVPVHVFKPAGCETVQQFEEKYGERLWEKDEDTYDFAVKVEPARRAYETFGVKSVITGRRASQGADRASLQPLEVDSTGLLKLNPLFAWNFHFVDWYIKSNNVPRNKLLDQGYKSVGDWHSTVKVKEGDDERAGRWAGKEKTECGLHKDYFSMKAKSNPVSISFPLPSTSTFPPFNFYLRTLKHFLRSSFLMSMPRNSPLRPDFGPNSERFPPLPKINSDAIRQKVFTHRSFYARPTHIFEDQPNDLAPDNEKLEHLGDTVLSLVVTNLMFDAYPGLHVGPSTKIRAYVVGNSTLADISVKYKLPSCLRLHRAQAITLQASTNVQADVFESYVGGLYLDQGLEAVKAWLDPLLLPYTEEAYKIVRTHYGLSPQTGSRPRPRRPIHHYTSSSASSSTEIDSPDRSPSPPYPRGGGMDVDVYEDTAHSTMAIGHLALFNQQLQKSDLDVEWVYSEDDGHNVDTSIAKRSDVPVGAISTGRNVTHTNVNGNAKRSTTPMWTVQAMVNGELYGKGKGTSKKAARHVAAKEGLARLGFNVCQPLGVWCLEPWMQGRLPHPYATPHDRRIGNRLTLHFNMPQLTP